MFSRNYKRAIYGKNPIADVTCHLKYSPILKIENDSPSEFQEKIRQQFPVYEKDVQSDIPDLDLSAVPPEMLKHITSVNHSFVSSDELISISLGSKALSITTGSYSTWVEFKDRWKPPLIAFAETYKPPFFNYISLNYRDVISRKALGLPLDTPWYELIQPSVLGELADPECRQCEFKMAFRKLVVVLPDSTGFLGVQHGIATSEEDNEPVYIIESTFFANKKKEIADVETVLDSFNNKAGSFFRWCITEKLHKAMEPKEI